MERTPEEVYVEIDRLLADMLASVPLVRPPEIIELSLKALESSRRPCADLEAWAERLAADAAEWTD